MPNNKKYCPGFGERSSADRKVDEQGETSDEAGEIRLDYNIRNKFTIRKKYVIRSKKH